MEAELVALSLTITETIFWKHHFGELPQEDEQRPTVFGDNQASIAFSKNQGSLGRAKHIHLRYCFVKDEISKGTIDLKYKDTKTNVADIFTKALPGAAFRKHKAALSVVPIPALRIQGSVGAAPRG